MNDGKLTKTFIGVGKNSEYALLNTEKNWHHGFFQSMTVNFNQDLSISQENIEQLRHANNVNFIIIDNDISTIKKTIEFFRLFKATYGEVDILGIVIVDSLNTVFNDDWIELHKQLQAITSAGFMHVNYCPPETIESLISMYNHMFCGFSIACAEFSDVYTILSSGYHFDASQVTVSTTDELPFAVYQAFDNIRYSIGELTELQGFSLIIISDDEFSLSLFEACSNMLKGCINTDVEFISSTNIKERNKHSIQLGAVFNKPAKIYIE
jgi:hypothetical protein